MSETQVDPLAETLVNIERMLTDLTAKVARFERFEPLLAEYAKRVEGPMFWKKRKEAKNGNPPCNCHD